MMKNEENTKRLRMRKTLREFTVLYKTADKFTPVSAKYSDPTVYTFKCGAVDEKDAVRLLTLAKTYYMTVKGKTVSHVIGFKVVRVYSGDSVRMFKGFRRMERKVVVIKSKMPRSAMKNYFGKGK